MNRGRLIPLIAGAIALLVVAGVASAGRLSQHGPRPLTGPFCVSKKTGVVREVGPKKACHKRESRRRGIGTTGPRGPKGDLGLQGPAGP